MWQDGASVVVVASFLHAFDVPFSQRLGVLFFIGFALPLRCPLPSTPSDKRRLGELEGEHASQAKELERVTSLRDTAVEKATKLEGKLEAASSQVRLSAQLYR